MDDGGHGTAQPEKATQIRAQIINLKKGEKNLHERIDWLGKELGPILTPEPPANVGVSETPMPTVALANELAGISLSIQSAIQKLEGILARIDLP